MRRDSVWTTRAGGYIEPLSPGYNILVRGSNKYVNFGVTVGDSGYGLRDNSGTMQFKNNSGSWIDIGSGSTGSDEKVKFNDGDPTAGYLSDKTVAGTGINLMEGIGADENKLVITNTAPFVDAASDGSTYGRKDGGWVAIVAGLGDMILNAIQSVTGLKTFDKEKIAMKGTSTGVNTISVANTSATSYTNTIPAKNGTFAMLDDIVDTGDKVKYDASDPTAGYIADKIVAGTGISVAEGTGGNENKLVVTSTITQATRDSLGLDTDDTVTFANLSGTNTGDQDATDFDIKDLTDSTNLRTTWSGKQDALGFTPEDVDNKRTSFQATPDDTHYPSEKLVKESLDAKANANNVLALDNTTAFTPDNDYEPATKKYVDDNAGQLPDITTKWTKGGDNIGAKKLLGSIDNQAIGLITNNLERLTILENGNVGIGTNNPGAKLDVVGIINSKNASIDGNYYATTSTDATFHNKALISAGGYALKQSAAGDTVVNASNNRTLYFNINNSPKMVLNAVGNLGIGTTTPQAKLDISEGNLDLDNTTNANQYGVISKNGTRFIHDFNYGDNGTVTTVGYNTFVGLNSGNLTMGSTATQSYYASYNTGVGYGTLQANTTGYYNSALGFQSLSSNTTGYNNTANGMYSLYSNTTGYYNSALGYASLYSNTTGYNNTANGMYSLYSNTTGYNNTANGMYSLYSNTTGNNNSALGYQSLYSNTTGNNNSALGFQSGRYIADGTTGRTTGNYGLYLGYNTKASADDTTNEIVIGYNAIGAGSNTAVIGNSSLASVYLGSATPNAKLYAKDANISSLTASKVVFTDASKNLTSTGIGTSSQFIKGDGSLDSNTYLTSADIVSQVEDSIVDGHTTVAPSGNAVYDALAGKQDALGFTPEDVLNKKTAMTGNTTSDTFYLTAKAIYDWATGLFQTLANKVTSFQVTPDDAHYPSEKLVKDSLDAKAPTANPTFTGTVTLADNARIDLTLPTADTYVTGNTTDSFASGYSSAVGDLVFFGSGGKWLEVDADAVATCKGLIGIALEAKSDTQAMKVALPGSFVRLDSWNWTVGATLYAGETLGAIQETIPTGADAIIKVIGFAVSADVIYFNPSPDQQSTVA